MQNYVFGLSPPQPLNPPPGGPPGGIEWSWGCELTSSKRALMMVFQCLMVVMESGWQMVRMSSPRLVALFRAALFSSSFFMKPCAPHRSVTAEPRQVTDFCTLATGSRH